MITGLNHITLAVNDLETSLSFYRDLLGCKAHVKWDGGAYLSAGDLWLCLSCDGSAPSQDYTHLAFAVDEQDFQSTATYLRQANVIEWKQNKSEGNSLYILDPDGHKLEIHSGDLQSRLDSLKTAPYSGLVWL